MVWNFKISDWELKDDIDMSNLIGKYSDFNTVTNREKLKKALNQVGFKSKISRSEDG